MNAATGGSASGDDPARIRAMFDAIASRYDLLNRLLSLGLDRTWRRRSAACVACIAPEGPIADVACGTGDLLIEVAAAAGNVAGSRLTIGIDFSIPMLAQAAAKIEKAGAGRVALIRADGRRLPLRDASLAGVTIAFGIRNFADLGEGIREMARVLAPGGVLGILEFTSDRTPWIDRLFRPYARFVIPLMGRLFSGDPSAYRYLPASVEAFATSGTLWRAIRRAGLEPVEERAFAGKICRLFLSRRLR